MTGSQALCRAEDPEDIRAATQAKAEQVAELAEFNENIPLDTEDRPSKEEEEEMSKAEQEIASLVEQVAYKCQCSFVLCFSLRLGKIAGVIKGSHSTMLYRLAEKS